MRPRPHLRLQLPKYVCMNVERNVVLHDPEALGLAGRGQLPLETGQFCPPDTSLLPIEQSATLYRELFTMTSGAKIWK